MRSSQFLLILLLAITAPISCECGLSLTLTSTNQRAHACPNETLVATCAGGTGRELEWDYNGTQFLFFDNDAELPAAMLRTVSTPVAAYLIGRTIEANETFRYTSQLSVARVTFDRVSITCTVNTNPINMTDVQTDSLFVETSVSPTSSVLKTDQLQCMGQDGNTAHYLIEWLPPDNIMDFDLAYYEVNLMTPNTSIVLLCINSTAIISFNLTIKSVTVSIVAVSQCGQRGAAVETPTLLGTCQSPASSSMSLKLSSMWTMLITACWLFNYYDACFLISVNRWFL